MKKITLLVAVCFATLLITSCKKSYSCNCEVKIYESGTLVTESERKESISSKMTEAQAESTCDHSEKQLKESYDEALADPTLSVKANCEVK